MGMNLWNNPDDEPGDAVWAMGWPDDTFLIQGIGLLVAFHPLSVGTVHAVSTIACIFPRGVPLKT
jgi:hypothetical protein